MILKETKARNRINHKLNWIELETKNASDTPNLTKYFNNSLLKSNLSRISQEKLNMHYIEGEFERLNWFAHPHIKEKLKRDFPEGRLSML